LTLANRILQLIGDALGVFKGLEEQVGTRPLSEQTSP
jgi:hypothetical protein